MKIELFGFQKEALHRLRESLVDARARASSANPRAITLSAATGSGKTVIMTALFEAILDGPDEQLDWPLDWQPQSDAVVLWVSDMPELNEQTKRKLETQSDKIFRASQLVTIDNSFDQERLKGGCVYFINTQKLANDKLLTREGDRRAFSLWRTLSNTARAIPDRFYVVIDEAHRGMSNKQAAARANSIVQRFVFGHPESGLVRMPLIIGISATPDRFDELLKLSEHVRFPVKVPPEDVRQSGLLKERILIHHPASAKNAEFGLLEEAARRWVSMFELWQSYCDDEHEPPVRPILVVQVEDGTLNSLTKTDLAAALAAITTALGRRLRDTEVAHAFMDKGELKIGEQRVRYIDPSRIEEDDEVSVVFFKMALSTGWDCPRAEVMMSFRRADDHTYIAQLLGRMVRTPLARRVDRNAELNDVHLFLPHFNEKAISNVIRALQNSEDVPPTEAASARELVILSRRTGTEAIFEAAHRLVTFRVNAHRAQSDIRRYQEMARRLTMDGIDDLAWDQAKADMSAWIGEQVEVLKRDGRYATEHDALIQLGINAVSFQSLTNVVNEHATYLIDVSDLDLDRQFHESGRILGNGLHQEYRKLHADRDADEVKLELIIATRFVTSISELERHSKAKFNVLFDSFRREFARLPVHSRTAYERLRASSTQPEPISWHLQETIDFRRDPKDQSWEKHLFVEEDGIFRSKLGTWEEAVLAEEFARKDFVGWLRNLDRKPWSLEIPYQSAGRTKPMFPDLLIVRQSDDGFLFDILEPHDPSLADNIDKAIGMAEFAEKYGDLFSRIELIRKRDSGFVRLQMHRAAVRDKLRVTNSNKQLDALFEEFA